MMGARKPELIVVGGSAPRRQAARKAGWTKAKELRFLEALSDTCNVRLSASRAKVANGTVYKRRAKDAAFRDGWARALAQGYARLEIETLERAINGTMRTIVHKDGREEVVVEHSDRVALALLRMHRDSAAEPARREREEVRYSAEEIAEVRARIVAKLERMRLACVPAPSGDDGNAA